MLLGSGRRFAQPLERKTTCATGTGASRRSATVRALGRVSAQGLQRPRRSIDCSFSIVRSFVVAPQGLPRRVVEPASEASLPSDIYWLLIFEASLPSCWMLLCAITFSFYVPLFHSFIQIPLEWLAHTTRTQIQSSCAPP